MIKNSQKLFGGLCAAAVVGLFSAGSRAEDKIAPGTMDFLASTTISGYVSTTYSYDFLAGATSQGDTIAHAAIGPRFNNFSINQFKLVLEKPLDASDWSAGYRVDIVAGEDAGWTAGGLGTGTGDLALAQAYVSARIPVGSGITAKAGKHYQPFGNEVFESPSNFNITRSLLYLFAQPTTFTGIQFGYTWDLSGDVTLDLLAGVANGWDQTGTTELNSNKAYYTQATLTFWEGKAKFATGYVWSTEQDDGTIPGDTERDRWLWDSVLTVKPTDTLTLSLNGDWGQESFPGAPQNEFWGLSGTVNYKWSDLLDTTLRAEFFSDNEKGTAGNTRIEFVTGLGVPGGQDMWSLTGTANFNIWKNLLTRVELRYTKVNEDFYLDDDDDQFIVALEAAYLF